MLPTTTTNNSHKDISLVNKSSRVISIRFHNANKYPPKQWSYKEKGLFGLTVSDPCVCGWHQSVEPAAAHYARSRLYLSQTTDLMASKGKTRGRDQAPEVVLWTYPWWPKFLLPAHCPSNGTTSQNTPQVGNQGPFAVYLSNHVIDLRLRSFDDAEKLHVCLV